ncbi:phosphoribosyltransferase [Candidatus Uhrbacteria bacterium]|nr:phosphoribosyltransferase [Candidatus Uhrbacteria bacterium]MBD3284250.1 phosphoribosyltransferase [Candidatus Uhrbacteria bacterium]
MAFQDRQHAGQQLAKALAMYQDREILLFALPRGGAVVAAEIAKIFGISMDLIITRKIGAPLHEEYALGALAETGEVYWNASERSHQSDRAVLAIVEKEREEAKRRINLYRKGRSLPEMERKTVLIVDDGLATGATMHAAVLAAKHQGAKEIVVAIPHGAADSIEGLESQGVKVVCLMTPEPYGAVGAHYETFDQTKDAEVLQLMEEYGPEG